MTVPGVISAAELYTLSEAKQRLHLGRHSFRALRAAGLQIFRVGRCCYVEGENLIETIKRIGEQRGGGEDKK